MTNSAGKILIVDDEPYISQILSRYLTSEAYQCLITSSGEEALKVLETGHFHLVIADIMMPGISGIDLLTIIRPFYPDVAVIIVTAVDDKDTGVLSVELGAYGYVVKPFERNEVLFRVANALERRRLVILAQERAASKPSLPQRVTLRRHPIRIFHREAVDLIRSGMDEVSLMMRFNLSAKALNSLFDQLVAAGALQQSEINERSSLSPDSEP